MNQCQGCIRHLSISDTIITMKGLTSNLVLCLCSVTDSKDSLSPTTLQNTSNKAIK